MLVALVGNQNCGKTTLFNELTGSNQHVGNFPGVTIDVKIGTVRNIKDHIEIADLPGIYSLTPYSSEEKLTRDFILNEKPDIILNIVDATNIERNLYLTLQLAELGVPMVIALNMIDEVRAAGNSIDILKLEEKLGIKVRAISASKREGIEELIDQIKRIGTNHTLPTISDLCPPSSPVHRAIHSMMILIGDHVERNNLPIRYVSTRVIEGDSELENKIGLNDNEKDVIDHIVKEMEKDANLDREAALALMRYDFIDNITKDTVIRKNPFTKEQIRSNKIDKILTNKWLAFPIFFLVMGLVFYLTFNFIGFYLSEWFGLAIDFFVELVRGGMTSIGFNEMVISLICDGILGGVGSVLSFVPTIITLFFFLSLLEDTGYMARIAFIMDKPLRKLGLSGKSFVPMLIGFGCSVPAIMATRTLTSERDKKLTVFLVPFMSCSAKLPIFTVLTVAFFGNKSALVMISMYALGIIMAIFTSAIIKAMSKGNPTPFMLELPAYRMPGSKSTLLLMWEKAKDFIKKAFTIIFAATIIIWFLQSFNTKLFYVTNNEESILALIAKFISPIFKPLGFDDWRVTSAVITGLSAKESVVSTLDVLLGDAALIGDVLTPLQGFSLLTFILLYMPCIAAYAAESRELNSFKKATFHMILQTAIAYFVAFAIYQIGGLIYALV